MAAALREKQQDALEASMEQIEQGLQIMPENQELLALRDQVQLQVQLRDAKEQAEAAQRQLQEIREQEAAQRQLQQAQEQEVAQREAQVQEVAQQTETIRQQAEDALVGAEQHRENGELEASLQTIAEGLQAVPEHAGLLALQQSILIQQTQQRKQTEQQQQQIQAILANARQLRDAGDLTDSLAAIKRGLELDPENGDLLTLRDALNTQQTESQLAGLLEVCSGHFKANRLTTGRGGNAFDCYSDILRQYPGNQDARSGLQRIEDQYVAWAEATIRKGDTTKTESYLQRLEQVNPQSSRLLTLRNRIAQIKQEAQTEAQAQAQAQAKTEAEAEAKARAEAEAEAKARAAAQAQAEEKAQAEAQAKAQAQAEARAAFEAKAEAMWNVVKTVTKQPMWNSFWLPSRTVLAMPWRRA
ncbi:MAG: hypothetical protein HC808_02065 [Candidatus Competibacteraceae bacterium]|nr:hypothetical protein [Candidatus Competibacteraceae bacterium]